MRLNITFLLIFGLIWNISLSQVSVDKLEKAEQAFNDFHRNSFQNRDSALKTCNEIIEIFGIAEKPCEQAKVMAFAGLLQTSGSNQKSGFEQIIQAQKQIVQGKCSDEYVFFIEWAYAAFYSSIGEKSRSDSISRLALNKYREQWNDPVTYTKLFLILSFNANDLGNKIENLERSLELSRTHSITYLEQRSLINMSAAYASSGDFEKAKSYTLEAMRVAHKRKAYLELSNLYNILAGISENKEDVKRYLDSSTHFASISGNLALLQDLYENKAYFYYQNGEYKTAYDNLWYSLNLRDSLFNIQKFEAIAEMEEKYETEKRENEIQQLQVQSLNAELVALNYKRNQNKLLIGSLVLFFLLIFFVWGFITLRKNRNQLAAKNIEIEEARKKSDDLLLNILPEEIAKELKTTGKAEARDYKRVSILFTDFIEFTQVSEKLSTEELVGQINTCFRKFDEILEQTGIEKIKTIGDSYMAAGDLPIPSEDSVASTVITALKMQDFMIRHKKEQEEQGKPGFEMRAGIHTGPVVAGIVGVKKFQYDIWGDTVNTASRMENTGEAGKVNISQSTYEIIKDDPRFTFEARGLIQAKGKGKMEMYFVERRSEG